MKGVTGAGGVEHIDRKRGQGACCLLYTSDAADERSSVALGGRRIIKNKINDCYSARHASHL